jgi:hypothetical protein
MAFLSGVSVSSVVIFGARFSRRSYVKIIHYNHQKHIYPLQMYVRDVSYP